MAAAFSLALVTGAPVPSHAVVLWNGTCLVTVTLTFSSYVRLNSGIAASVGIDASATICAVSNTTISGTRLDRPFGLGGSGSGAIATTCEALAADGSYSADFGATTPTPPSNSGSWAFTGNLASGLLTLIGETSNGGTFIAAASLVPALGSVGSIVTCASLAAGTGITSFTFLGSMTFNDPEI